MNVYTINKIDWEQKYYAVKTQGWCQSLTRKTYILQKKHRSQQSTLKLKNVPESGL